MRESIGYRAEQAGLLSAATTAPLAYQRTLMPRSLVDQALVSGLAIATNHALVTVVQEGLQSAALVALHRRGRSSNDDVAWSRATLAVDALAVSIGLAAQRAFAARPREHLPRAGARSAGYWLARSGTAGLVIGSFQEALGQVGDRRPRSSVPAAVPAAIGLGIASELRRRSESQRDVGLEPMVQVQRTKAVALGLAVTALTSGIGVLERRLAGGLANGAQRVLPGGAAIWRPVGHVTSLALLGGATRAVMQQAFTKVESIQESVEPALDIPPPVASVSGSLDSLVEFDTLARAGRRFVWTVSTVDRVEEVMGEAAVRAPARAYVGLLGADSEAGRVELAMQELERLEAFERGWLMVALPTGTGYVNYAAVTALEMLSRGDCTTIGMQYAARPSPMSLDRVSDGRNHARLLLDAISQRLAGLDPQQRPKLVLFGESLGAWTSQDAFIGRGTQGLVETGIDHAIWIGTPHFSKWKEQVLHDDGPEIDRGLIGVFNDIGEWRALDPAARERIRYLMITHHDDGVAVFGPELSIQAPEWLGDPAQRPATVPKSMRWMPSTTFFQVLVDMKNAANVVPGVLEAKGHDYRADLLPFFHEALGFEASPEQLERITAFLMETELRRTYWMSRHGTAGNSLSAALSRRWMEQERAAGRDPSEVLVHAFRALVDEAHAAATATS